MKKLSILLILIVSFLLSSCIKTSTVAVIDDKFNISEKTVMDFTKINNISAGINLDSQTGSKIKTPCENFWEQDKKSENEKRNGDKKIIYGYTKIDCKDLDKNKGLVSMNGGSVKKFITKKDDIYVFDLNKGLGGDSKNNEEKYTKEQREQSIQMLKGWGIEVNYQFKFPGEIISSDYGTFKGDTLYINIYDIMKSDIKNPVLKFKNEGNVDEVTSVVYTDLSSESDLMKKLIIAKKNLSGNLKMQKLIKKIDVLIPKMKKDKLQSLYNKLSDYDLADSKYRKIKDIIIYIKAKAGLELYK